jgi:hypothetical protein
VAEVTGGREQKECLPHPRCHREVFAADKAAVAWKRLSNACHLDAFEMQPSSAEVEKMCSVVADLLP